MDKFKQMDLILLFQKRIKICN